MRKPKQKLIYNPIYPDRPTNQLHTRILRVLEDEILAIESRQIFSADSTGESRHVVYVWLLNHSAHCPFDAAIFEFVEGVFVPNGFEVECWAAHM